MARTPLYRITSMKINRFFRILGLLLLTAMPSLFLRVSADDTNPAAPTTFVVKDGSFPWSDRVNVWQLLGVPATLAGNGPLPQQLCSNRSIAVPDGTKSVIFAVSAGDVDKLKSDFPTVQPTGDSLSVAHADGTEMINYTVFKLVSPPGTIGDPAFGAGVILLQLNDKAPSNPSTNAPSATAPAK